MLQYTILNAKQQFSGTYILILYNIKISIFILLVIFSRVQYIMCKIRTRDRGKKRRKVKLQRKAQMFRN